MGSSKQDIYDSLKQLMEYLKTEVDVISGEVEEKAHGKVVATKPGYIVNITVSNTAPIEQTWPMVVFTGVNLVTKKVPGVQMWINHHHYKVDISKAPQQDRISSFPESFWGMQPLSLQSQAFPVVTSDERKHGYFLFPGQSIVFEFGVKSDIRPNVKDLDFWVQGSLSRHHLFHSMKQIL